MNLIQYLFALTCLQLLLANLALEFRSHFQIAPYQNHFLSSPSCFYQINSHSQKMLLFQKLYNLMNFSSKIVILIHCNFNSLHLSKSLSKFRMFSLDLGKGLLDQEIHFKLKLKFEGSLGLGTNF